MLTPIASELPMADRLVNVAVLLIFLTWFFLVFAAFIWLSYHVEKLTPNVLFRRRQTGKDKDATGRGGGNVVAVLSLVVAILTLIITTILGIAQLLHR